MSDPNVPGPQNGPERPRERADDALPPPPVQERTGSAETRVRRTARKAMIAGVSLVWLVPIIALIATLGLAWNSWSQRGTLVQVAFADATGINPGETVLRFREVSVGRVESVRFTTDLSRVVVDLRVDKDVAPYIDRDAQFWVVRPEVSTSGISRLDTVLTGAFIEGDWDATAGQRQEGPFNGLDRAPLTRPNQPGTWVVLEADTARGLSEGAQVLYHGVPVGRMENIRLSPEDQTVLADVFIEAPQDQRLTSATVFWDTSGLSVSLGAQGLALNVGSVSSLLQGGVQFETLTSGGAPVRPGQVFRLYPNEEEARDGLINGTGEGEVDLTVLVDDGVRGLAKGADVQFEGLNVGRVTDLRLRIEEGPNSARTVHQEVTISVLPTRLGLPPETTREEALTFLSRRVAEGLRARVTSAGFLGTSLIIELADIPDAEPASLDVAQTPNPVIPSVPGEITDFSATAEGFISRIGELPLNETLRSAQDMMNSVTALVSSQEVRAVPQDVSRTLQRAEDAIAEIEAVVGELRASGAIARAGGAVDAAQRAAEAVADAAEGVPSAVQNIDRVASNLAQVDMKALGDAVTGAADGIRGIATAPQAQALPGLIAGALGAVEETVSELGSVTADLRRQNIARRLADLLDAGSSMVQAVEIAADDVPEMVAQVEEAANEMEAFDFAGIGAEARGILTDIRAMLGTEDAEQLPRNLSNTLEAAAGLLNDLRDGNAAGSLNAALASARTAADNVSAAVQRAPQLMQRIEQLAGRAEGVIAAYGDRSTFNTEIINTLRELRRATAAFGQLAQTIERNPRAFILGR